MSLLMVAAICAAGYANPRPHVVRTADDAKATAYAETGEDTKSFWSYWSRRDWNSKYEAKRDGGVWRLIPLNVPGATYKGEGENITIDARTGCVVNVVYSD